MGGALIFQKPSGVGFSGGTSNEPQRSVDLQGPSAEGQVVPNVIGLDIDSASKLIEEAGFAIGGLEFANSDDVRSQCVISQEVAAGQTLQEGISIDLTISNGPAKHECAGVSGKKTWGEAKAYCEGKGDTLVCINSQEEYDEVPEVAKAAGRKVFWLGGYLNGDEFAWVDGGPSPLRHGLQESRITIWASRAGWFCSMLKGRGAGTMFQTISAKRILPKSSHS